MITVDSLTKKYGGFTAVDDVSFTARPGRVTGFLGPNGAGKSTTMRVMVGLTPATSGDVTVVDLSGALNLGPATERLHDKINSLLQQDRKRIILNLGDVTSVDSGGLGELVRTHTSAKGRGGSVKVVNLPKRNQDLLVMTRLVTVFDTFDNEADAIKSFQ